jgi:hypothetical protein
VFPELALLQVANNGGSGHYARKVLRRWDELKGVNGIEGIGLFGRGVIANTGVNTKAGKKGEELGLEAVAARAQPLPGPSYAGLSS